MPASIGASAGRRPRFRIALTLAGILALAAGCRLDMHVQPRYEPLGESGFFRDRRASRPLVEGTVPRGHLYEDDLLHTGMLEGDFARVFPFPVTADVLERGRTGFNVFCAPCHDRLGEGLGMIVQRGYRRPPSLHDDRLRQVAPGYMFAVMTNGFGVMPDYREEVPVRDRWAIVAYIRALQLTRQGRLADVPADRRPALAGAAGQDAAEAPR